MVLADPPLIIFTATDKRNIWFGKKRIGFTQELTCEYCYILARAGNLQFNYIFFNIL